MERQDSIHMFTAATTIGGIVITPLRVLTTRQAPGGPVVPDLWKAERRCGGEIAVRQRDDGTWATAAEEKVEKMVEPGARVLYCGDR